MSGYEELGRILKFRPLASPLPTPVMTTSPFKASWTSTVELLTDESRHLGAKGLLLEAAFTEAQLRLDGIPRAGARPSSQGVVLTVLGTPHGDLRYPCHRFPDWQSNVRGIALSLEALRKVDRYGVTKRGEQYSGWKALPAGNGPSALRGRAIVDSHGGNVRRAELATHPDTRGEASPYSDADFAHVQAYKETL